MDGAQDTRSILILEDCRTTRRIFCRMLGALGFEAREAASGVAGLAQLALRALPAAVIVDWNMPEMDGIEFVTRMRADPRYRDVKVLMATSRRQMEEIREALEAGADEFIMKPFTQEMLADKLQLLGVESEAGATGRSLHERK